MDYRFAIQCWQDQAGSEDAKANVFVDGVQVATEVAVTATSADSPQLITWESTGLTAPAADTSFDIKVVMTNDYYVDSDTDRNIIINSIGYTFKGNGDNYIKPVSDGGDPEVWSSASITDTADFNSISNYFRIIPTAVTGDQIADNWWSSRATDTFYYVYVWGGSAEGVTITIPASIGS
jgi:hypothetical protein